MMNGGCWWLIFTSRRYNGSFSQTIFVVVVMSAPEGGDVKNNDPTRLLCMKIVTIPSSLGVIMRYTLPTPPTIETISA